jgi:hypothetical protein
MDAFRILDRILKEEVHNAYRLANALHGQFLFVRCSLISLISAIVLLVALLLLFSAMPTHNP